MAALIIATGIIFLAAGVPLFAVLGMVVAGCILFLGDGFLTEIAADMFNAVNKDILLAIPFFVVAGQVMTKGSIAARIIRIAGAAFGWMPAGLAVAAVAACVFFASISGSSPVTLIAVGSIMFPALIKEKYRETFSIGLLSCGGTLGILIPPSIPMILYAIAASRPGYAVPVGDLFLAGIAPGLLIAVVLGLYAIAFGGQLAKRRKFNARELANACKEGAWSLLLPVGVLGGIYSGLCTATEAAAIAAVMALAIELFIHRDLGLRAVPALLTEASSLMGTLFLIIILAMSLNQFLSLEQIPLKLTDALQRIVHDKHVFLLGVNALLLVAGCFMDIMSAILILGPILAPMASAYGIDPIHFGIIFIVNLEIGYLTPPIGLNLFVASTVFRRPLSAVIAASWPFIVLMMLCLLLIAFVPDISLGLIQFLRR